MKRLMFWGAVAGVSVLANLGIELLAPHLPPGFARLVALTHQGSA